MQMFVRAPYIPLDLIVVALRDLVLKKKEAVAAIMAEKERTVCQKVIFIIVQIGSFHWIFPLL